MVKIKDIAKKCGVSVSTVSKALADYPDINENTVKYIREVARNMGYLPNAAARALRTNRSYNIGVLFIDKTSSGLRHEFFSGILNSVKVGAESRGYDITFTSKNIGNLEMTYYEHAKYRNCDGVIIASIDFADQDVIKLVESEVPTVTIDHIYNNRTAILSDNVRSMQELVEYIVAQGHRKIAFIHGEDTYVTQQRLASFRKVCLKQGLDIPEEYIKEGIYHDPRSSALMTRELLALKNRPSCILYPDDFSFIGGMNEIERQGLSIPDDISVVGYDGILLSQVLRPRLTTYRQNVEEIGKTAADKLIDMIENPKLFIPEQIVIPGEVIIGDTVKKI
ncbi:MAG TPA: LacI family transcriptional regulator [Acholeplasmataceae bacterium]|jgi:LacI family transcriptional regulator|nr:LacI family transcriptional regulator [Acholeplasmataceae bacterium]